MGSQHHFLPMHRPQAFSATELFLFPVPSCDAVAWTPGMSDLTLFSDVGFEVNTSSFGLLSRAVLMHPVFSFSHNRKEHRACFSLPGNSICPYFWCEKGFMSTAEREAFHQGTSKSGVKLICTQCGIQSNVEQASYPLFFKLIAGIVPGLPV